jgi:hypothetical protein
MRRAIDISLDATQMPKFQAVLRFFNALSSSIYLSQFRLHINVTTSTRVAVCVFFAHLAWSKRRHPAQRRAVPPANRPKYIRQTCRALGSTRQKAKDFFLVTPDITVSRRRRWRLGGRSVILLAAGSTDPAECRAFRSHRNHAPILGSPLAVFLKRTKEPWDIAPPKAPSGPPSNADKRLGLFVVRNGRARPASSDS